jgi:hypothetical protein
MAAQRADDPLSAATSAPGWVPQGLTEEARADWLDLATATEEPAAFDAAMTTDLPEPVRRWLAHVIAPGTPLLTSVELSMRGQIRLGAWRDFTAVQRLAPGRGFVWAATARMLGLPVIGFDRYSRYTRGAGETRWKLLGKISVLSGGGPDVTRSAADRYAGELLVVVPAAALSPNVRWQEIDADRATARIRVGAGQHDVTLTVSAAGELTSLSTERWGATGEGSFAERPFTADFTGEVTFDGVTMPKEIAAGWAPEPFIRYTIESAAHR